MKGFPPELIYVLLFIGIFLVQFLKKRRGAQKPRDGRPEPRIPDSPDEIPTDFAWGGQPAPLAAEPSRASVEPLVRPEAPATLRARSRFRFSRRSLLGTRRDVQNAVVIATILGPCRALEPPGGEAASTSPRRAAR
jgi:hypothetical protein